MKRGRSTELASSGWRDYDPGGQCDTHSQHRGTKNKKWEEKGAELVSLEKRKLYSTIFYIDYLNDSVFLMCV